MLITKQNFTTLRRDIEAALAAVATKHNIRITSSRGHYSVDGLTGDLKLEFIGTGASTPAGAPIDTKSVMDFKRECSNYGLKPEHLGATITYAREKYRLDGMAGGCSWKYVFAVTRLSDGKRFRLPEAAVNELRPGYKPLFGSAPVVTAPTFGTCSELNSFDTKLNAKGKCENPATTFRKVGFGKNGVRKPFCEFCAKLRDEARNEMEAEARVNRY